jgi:hypothetical protein
MAAVSQASYGHATPSSGTTSLKRKGEKGEKIYTAAKASTREGASGAGRGGQAQKPKKRKGIISAGCLPDRPWNAANLC